MSGKIFGILLFLIMCGPAEARNINDKINSPITQDFIMEMSSVTVFEINSGETAMNLSHNEEVKLFAAKVMEDYKQIDADLKAALTEDQKQYLNVQASPAMNAAMSNLEQAKPEAFDKVYLKTQESISENTLRVLNRYASQGNDKRLKALAVQAAVTLKRHKFMLGEIISK
jgi:predicted outer membrane protein